MSSIQESIHAEREEIGEVVNRLLDYLSLSISSRTGREGVILRNKIGDLRATYLEDLRDRTFSTKLFDCFTAARDANVKLESLLNVHQKLFEETPVGIYPTSIIQIATVFCLAAESRMITDIEFTSRDDVEAMINVMKEAFETAKELAADAFDSGCYQTLNFLAGALINHLATTARPLPRMVAFHLPVPLPALALSNRIYYTADRWQEITLENKIIHPAFCPREIRGLSK